MYKSFGESVFPTLFKHARVKPLLRGENLNKEELKSYRSVSNLSFMVKLLERVASNHLEVHLDKNKLRYPLQSAYKKYHSAETTIPKVHTA